MKILASMMFNSESEQESIRERLSVFDLKFGEERGGIAFNGIVSYEDCMEIVKIVESVPTTNRILSFERGPEDGKTQEGKT